MASGTALDGWECHGAGGEDPDSFAPICAGSRQLGTEQRRFGQIYGFILALCFMIASFILILLGFGIYGTILGSVNLISLVTIFVLDKSQNDYSPQGMKYHLQ